MNGGTASRPTDPDSGDDVFVGWSTVEGDENSLFDFTTPITAELALYAVFSEAPQTVGPFTVTYYVNGEVYDEQEVVDGGTASKPTDPDSGDDEFVGWSTVEGDENSLFDFTNTTITEDIDLYAVFRS